MPGPAARPDSDVNTYDNGSPGGSVSDCRWKMSCLNSAPRACVKAKSWGISGSANGLNSRIRFPTRFGGAIGSRTQPDHVSASTYRYIGERFPRKRTLADAAAPEHAKSSGCRVSDLRPHDALRLSWRAALVTESRPYRDCHLLTSVSGWYSGFSMGSIIRKRSPSAETSYSKFGVRR